ncbi:YDJ1 Mitochondrial protein import protein MAS5 [Candida maltosa Xu316]|uniref:DnaJ family protein chaperone, putative n=1 Tax=Candida maltosa (strain Xu316) TaxID=1245528 RepID=M3K0E3_CANMX|nr:DnaJ family protein chaperone, putative [Candida maltosa Xu316]
MVRETFFYDILSVDVKATTEEISRSYKKQALKCHPDKTNHDPELTEKFKLMTRAYEVLRDPRQRDIYDRYGEAGLEGMVTQESSSSRNHRRTHSFATDIFSQVFQDINQMFSNHNAMFDGMPRPPQFPGFPNNQNMKKHVQPIGEPIEDHLIRGEDIYHTCEVNLSDMAYGKIIKLSLPKNTKCYHCNGQGGVNPMTCRSCLGSGRVLITYSNQFTRFQQTGSCATCEGTGTFIRPRERCDYCDMGYTETTKIIKVIVPPGAAAGDRIIVKGEADEGRNVIPGDLVIKLKQREHPFLVRRYDDLYMDCTIDLKTALLGGEVYVENFLKQGQVLKIYINVHGYASLNDPNVQIGEVVGTIKPGEPKIVQGLGMPINTQIRNAMLIQTPQDLELSRNSTFDLESYEHGNLYINFHVHLPSIEHFSESDLTQMHDVFSRTIGPQYVPPGNIVESNLANIPGTKRNPINLDPLTDMGNSTSKESTDSVKLDFNEFDLNNRDSSNDEWGQNKRRRFDDSNDIPNLI